MSRASARTASAPWSRKVPHRSSVVSPAVTWVRYSRTRSLLSWMPSLASSGLGGTQNPPPDSAVEPPTYSDFSTTRTERPASFATSAASIPVPAPTTTKSYSWVWVVLAVTVMLWLRLLRRYAVVT